MLAKYFVRLTRSNWKEIGEAQDEYLSRARNWETKTGFLILQISFITIKYYLITHRYTIKLQYNTLFLLFS